MTLSFCPELDEMYRTRRAVGQSGRAFDNLAALSTPNNLLTLRALMMSRKPASTLEVGMSFGGSALAIAASHRDLGHPPEGQHVAIDPYQQSKEGERFDLIYVDGSHLFEDVFVDAYFGIGLLSEHGIILFDDSTDPHVAKVLRFLTSNWTGWTKPFDLAPYRPDGQSARYRIGRLLGKTQLRAFRRTASEPRAWNSRFTDF